MHDMHLCLENYGLAMWFNDFNKLNHLTHFWGSTYFIYRKESSIGHFYTRSLDKVGSRNNSYKNANILNICCIIL